MENNYNLKQNDLIKSDLNESNLKIDDCKISLKKEDTEQI